MKSEKTATEANGLIHIDTYAEALITCLLRVNKRSISAGAFKDGFVFKRCLFAL